MEEIKHFKTIIYNGKHIKQAPLEFIEKNKVAYHSNLGHADFCVKSGFRYKFYSILSHITIGDLLHLYSFNNLEEKARNKFSEYLQGRMPHTLSLNIHVLANESEMNVMDLIDMVFSDAINYFSYSIDMNKLISESKVIAEINKRYSMLCNYANYRTSSQTLNIHKVDQSLEQNENSKIESLKILINEIQEDLNSLCKFIDDETKQDIIIELSQALDIFISEYTELSLKK